MSMTQILIIFTVFIVNDAAENSISEKLYQIQQSINRNRSIHYHGGAPDQMTTAAAIYHAGYLKYYTGDLPVLILGTPFQCEFTSRIGNFLGNYFDAISCAAATGMHFIGIKNFQGKHFNFPHYMFFEAFPDIIVHPNPVKDTVTARNLLFQKCSCTRYCWNQHDPWRQQIPLISSIIERGVYLHLASKDKHGIPLDQRGLSLDPSKDVFSVPVDTFLPIGPDVAIHYRCSDNLFAGMGLMSFGTIIHRIPPDSKTIYIFTEYGNRLKDTPLAAKQKDILRGLFEDICRVFPSATVVVKRGGNELTSWAALFLAKVSICSPSTYSLWPTLARQMPSYMPATEYVGASRPYFISEHFHWILKKPFLNFTKDTATEDILRTLRYDL